MESCLTDIYIRMSQNKLNPNTDKTDVQMRAKNASITIIGLIVSVLNESVSNVVGNHMSAHELKVIKSANYQIRNIGIIKFLNTDTTKSAIVSLETSPWTIIMDISVELQISYYADSRKSKTMPPEWLVAPKSMIELLVYQFQKILSGWPSEIRLSLRFCF